MIKGHTLLEGGAEFGGRMAEPDLRALELAGGVNARVGIIPAAAAPDNNHQRAGENGVRWFNTLGATDVTLLPLIDRASANLPAMADSLLDFQLIYLLGGFPLYLCRVLAGSLSWKSMLEAHERGTVLCGSSAGAMVLCRHFFDPATMLVEEGLGLVPRVCIIPHHDTSGKNWARHLMGLIPNEILIGIDEETGMIDCAPEHRWNVYGKGTVTLYRNADRSIYSAGETITF